MNYLETSHNVITYQVSSLLPSNKNRSILVHSLVKCYGLLSLPQAHVVPPIPADINALTMYHSRDFVECLLDSGTCDADADSNKLAQFGIEEVSVFIRRRFGEELR